ncbi:hypothetical protein JDM601_1375 [Mycolicibacter sinensis]|uniref:DUF732 domain-containing protein n=1 Tax=Mycolicibacter sinensis (strain JDM601) TaxID=875328 RepID=F5YXA6_MYCSD|nr:DUF732 domain-containing protein [Mycolicibacter sinensis]AEF35375.1 hypothetical protein JDM601_1375 [Mycolicibacter sinensis]
MTTKPGVYPRFRVTRWGLTGVAAFAIAIGLASPTSASAGGDTKGYIKALDAAGLMSHGGSTCNIIDGICHGQFPDGPAALQTGMRVCRQVQNGQSRASIVYELSHGEGLMPSSYNAPIIYDAATKYLC